MKKAQVSSEYLVILAVVLVLAILVVFLISQGSQLGKTVSDSQSKSYWSSQSPFSITGWAIKSNTVELEVTNRDAQTLTLTEVDADGASHYSTPNKFVTGQTKKIILTAMPPCTKGDPTDYDIDFHYIKNNLTTLLQDGEKSIVGTCQ